MIIKLIQLLLSIVFLLSGLAKLIDPKGFSYKLEEYFGPSVFDIPELISISLYLSLVVIILEILLSISLLVGYHLRVILFVIIIVLLFFGFLTFYSAYYNKVTDCGCFGDAIKFTPWQSFFKDLILILLTVLLAIYRNKCYTFGNKNFRLFCVFTTTIICVIFGIYSLYHLPIIDFRPYKIGNSIKEQMRIPPWAKKAKYEEVWYYKVNGVVKKYSSNQMPWDIEGAEFVNRETILVEKGYTPAILDFVVEKNGVIYTDSLLNTVKSFVIVSNDINEVSDKALNAIKSFFNQNSIKNYRVFIISPSNSDDIKKLFGKFAESLTILTVDETTSKTIIRANPGIVILHKDKIMDKKHWRDILSLKID